MLLLNIAKPISHTDQGFWYEIYWLAFFAGIGSVNVNAEHHLSVLFSFLVSTMGFTYGGQKTLLLVTTTNC